jgi:hypothetical protein
MKAMERWADDVAKPLAMLSQVSAHTISLHGEKIAQIVDKPSIVRVLAKDVDLPRWRSCYENPKAFLQGMRNFASVAGLLEGLDFACVASAVEKSWVRRILRWHAQIWRGHGYKVERAVDALCERYYHEHHLRQLDGTDESGNMPEGIDALLGSAEMIFFMGVVLPCWLRHQTLPWVLVERAADRDFAAFKSLLEIDPRADNVARLAAESFRLSCEENEQYLKLQAAKIPTRKKQTTTEDLKTLVASWLLTMSHALQDIYSGRLFATIARRCVKSQQLPALNVTIKKMKAEAARHPLRSRISAAKARKLVNAAAEDAGQGKTDRDFTTAPDSVERQLRRKAKLWPSLWESDNSRAA